MTANNRLISLIDANNFYVSCERVFRPELIGKPVAVLSNNDGCVVSRSQEIKDLGVKMGVPAFQIQRRITSICYPRITAFTPASAPASCRF